MTSVIVQLTARELAAVVAELNTVIVTTEENPGPHHPQHHDAKRALAKLRKAQEEQKR